MKWTILDKPEEMRLDGKPIWVYAKHDKGSVEYRERKHEAEKIICGEWGLGYGWTTTEATPLPTYRHYKRIPDVRGEKLRRKRDGMEFVVFAIGEEEIWITDNVKGIYKYTNECAFGRFEYPDGTPFGEVEE